MCVKFEHRDEIETISIGEVKQAVRLETIKQIHHLDEEALSQYGEVAKILRETIPNLHGRRLGGAFSTARKEQKLISANANWVAYIPQKLAGIAMWHPGMGGSMSFRDV